MFIITVISVYCLTVNPWVGKSSGVPTVKSLTYLRRAQNELFTLKFCMLLSVINKVDFSDQPFWFVITNGFWFFSPDLVPFVYNNEYIYLKNKAETLKWIVRCIKPTAKSCFLNKKRAMSCVAVSGIVHIFSPILHKANQLYR